MGLSALPCRKSINKLPNHLEQVTRGRRAAVPGAGAPNSLATAQARELVTQAPERPSRLALGPLCQPKCFCAHPGGWRAAEPSARATPRAFSSCSMRCNWSCVAAGLEGFLFPSFCQGQEPTTPSTRSGDLALPLLRWLRGWGCVSGSTAPWAAPGFWPDATAVPPPRPPILRGFPPTQAGGHRLAQALPQGLKILGPFSAPSAATGCCAGAEFPGFFNPFLAETAAPPHIPSVPPLHHAAQTPHSVHDRFGASRCLQGSGDLPTCSGNSQVSTRSSDLVSWATSRALQVPSPAPGLGPTSGLQEPVQVEPLRYSVPRASFKDLQPHWVGEVGNYWLVTDDQNFPAGIAYCGEAAGTAIFPAKSRT